jgi:hypothetical protein
MGTVVNRRRQSGSTTTDDNPIKLIGGKPQGWLLKGKRPFARRAVVGSKTPMFVEMGAVGIRLGQRLAIGRKILRGKFRRWKLLIVSRLEQVFVAAVKGEVDGTTVLCSLRRESFEQILVDLS